MTVPYTYLLGWKKQNKYYYGVRFAKNCHPNDLWVSYFTSSKNVESFRKQYGNPDIVEIRKIFVSREKAILWENKVLQKMNVISDDKWLNRTNNKAIHPEDCSKAFKGKTGSNHPAYGRKNTFLSEYNKINNVIRNKKYSGALHPFYGKTGSDHPAYGFRKMTREELKEHVICPHCSKKGKLGGMQRWHFDNCKKNQPNIEQQKGA
jgi:hypothetical protein